VENGGNTTRLAVSEPFGAVPVVFCTQGTLYGLDLGVPFAQLRNVLPMTMGLTGTHRLERRRSTRYPYKAILEIEWGSARLRARTRDISEGGMFIESEDVLWVGAGFRARLATERPMWLECSVKRVEPGRGMGVTVLLPECQSQQHYKDLVAKLAASR